jgi:hypothetical protein
MKRRSIIDAKRIVIEQNDDLKSICVLWEYDDGSGTVSLRDHFSFCNLLKTLYEHYSSQATEEA